MIDAVLELIFGSAAFVAAVVGFFALMRAAADWSQSQRTAIVAGLVILTLGSVVGGEIWAEGKARSCPPLRAEFVEAEPQLAREYVETCHTEQIQVLREHQLALLVLLAVAGVQGFGGSAYRGRLSYLQAVQVFLANESAKARYRTPKYSEKTFEAAMRLLGDAPPSAELAASTARLKEAVAVFEDAASDRFQV